MSDNEVFKSEPQAADIAGSAATRRSPTPLVTDEPFTAFLNDNVPNAPVPGILDPRTNAPLWGFGYAFTESWMALWAKGNGYHDFITAISTIQCYIQQPDLPFVTAPLRCVLVTETDLDKFEQKKDQHVYEALFLCVAMNISQEEIDSAAEKGEKLKTILTAGVPEPYTPEDQEIEPAWFRIWRN